MKLPSFSKKTVPGDTEKPPIKKNLKKAATSHRSKIESISDSLDKEEMKLRRKAEEFVQKSKKKKVKEPPEMEIPELPSEDTPPPISKYKREKVDPTYVKRSRALGHTEPPPPPPKKEKSYKPLPPKESKKKEVPVPEDLPIKFKHPKLRSETSFEKSIEEDAEEVQDSIREVIPDVDLPDLETPRPRGLPRPRTENELRAELAEAGVETSLKTPALRRLRSMFGEKSADIIQYLESGNNDGAMTLISRSLLQTLVDILPVIERSVRKSKGMRGVHNLNQTISQVREMCNDIQSFKDREQTGQMLIDRFIRSTFLDVAVQITVMLSNIEQSAKISMSDRDFQSFKSDVLEVNKRALADYIRRQYEDMCKSILKSMN